MNINNLIHIEDRFISVIPGTELTDCIKAVVEHCKQTNTSNKLEFNGVCHTIEAWIDPTELSKLWYSGVSKEWYDQQRVKSRDKNIDEVIK